MLEQMRLYNNLHPLLSLSRFTIRHPRTDKLPVDKIRKYGAEEFRATTEDDPERAEFWLENTIRVLDELPYTPAKCLKCAVSLLNDSTYQWWNMLILLCQKNKLLGNFSKLNLEISISARGFLIRNRRNF